MIINKIKLLFFILIIIYVCKQGFSQRKRRIRDDPCRPYNPPIPNFSRQGRRLSTEKCYEYIWRVKHRIDKMDRETECQLSKCTSPCGGGGIGGRDTLDGEFPHMAAIGWAARNPYTRWHFKCCGSLISEKFVLTAGHCVRAVRDTQVADPVPKIVRVGNKNIANDNEHLDIDIVTIIPHYNYRPPKKYYDVALMKIAEPIEFTFYIQPACLLTDGMIGQFGPSVTATGWGITELRGQPSEELQAVSLELLDSDFCDPLLTSSCNRHWCGIQDHQICAANLSGGVDTCSGDSGGPLQVNIPFPDKYRFIAKMHGIIGVTSFGVKCALRNSPGIYTRVAYFMDWIEDIVWRSKDPGFS